MYVAAGSFKTSAGAYCVAAALTLAIAANATAQQAAPGAAPNSASAIRLPDQVQVFGQNMPSVVKATAIVNGEVITQTDIDQRLALLLMSNNEKIFSLFDMSSRASRWSMSVCVMTSPFTIAVALTTDGIFCPNTWTWSGRRIALALFGAAPGAACCAVAFAAMASVRAAATQ